MGVWLGVSTRGLDQLFVHYRPRKATGVRNPVDAASTNHHQCAQEGVFVDITVLRRMLSARALSNVAPMSADKQPPNT
jgi:hypothetical protein